VSNKQPSDLAAERLCADCVGESCQRIRAHACTLDERADHGLWRQRLTPKYARVQYGRVDGVRTNESVALAV